MWLTGYAISTHDSWYSSPNAAAAARARASVPSRVARGDIDGIRSAAHAVVVEKLCWARADARGRFTTLPTLATSLDRCSFEFAGPEAGISQQVQPITSRSSLCTHPDRRRALAHDQTMIVYMLLSATLADTTGDPGLQHLPSYLTFYDYNATDQASFCNLGTSTPKPNSTVVTNDSLIIRGFRDHGLPGLLDVEDIGGGFNRGLYFRDGINNTHLNPKWQQLLGAMLDSALPFIEEGAIKGVRNSCD